MKSIVGNEDDVIINRKNNNVPSDSSVNVVKKIVENSSVSSKPNDNSFKPKKFISSFPAADEEIYAQFAHSGQPFLFLCSGCLGSVDFSVKSNRFLLPDFSGGNIFDYYNGDTPIDPTLWVGEFAMKIDQATIKKYNTVERRGLINANYSEYMNAENTILVLYMASSCIESELLCCNEDNKSIYSQPFSLNEDEKTMYRHQICNLLGVSINEQGRIDRDEFRTALKQRSFVPLQFTDNLDKHILTIGEVTTKWHTDGKYWSEIEIGFSPIAKSSLFTHRTDYYYEGVVGTNFSHCRKIYEKEALISLCKSKLLVSEDGEAYIELSIYNSKMAKEIETNTVLSPHEKTQMLDKCYSHHLRVELSSDEKKALINYVNNELRSRGLNTTLQREAYKASTGWQREDMFFVLDAAAPREALSSAERELLTLPDSQKLAVCDTLRGPVFAVHVADTDKAEEIFNRYDVLYQKLTAQFYEGSGIDNHQIYTQLTSEQRNLMSLFLLDDEKADFLLARQPAVRLLSNSKADSNLVFGKDDFYEGESAELLIQMPEDVAYTSGKYIADNDEISAYIIFHSKNGITSFNEIALSSNEARYFSNEMLKGYHLDFTKNIHDMAIRGEQLLKEAKRVDKLSNDRKEDRSLF